MTPSATWNTSPTGQTSCTYKVILRFVQFNVDIINEHINMDKHKFIPTFIHEKYR